jgi:hypothetical protein
LISLAFPVLFDMKLLRLAGDLDAEVRDFRFVNLEKAAACGITLWLSIAK